ncbi:MULTISPECIES: Sec-independent protein translocase protein TatB [unclassified Corallococcus]|uniref:Sec-independent protein translocase protein TatB n=1 Tax=unclassified Corallococcus TaxID=2685029 RepID=UPI001A8D6DDC|nr:MULTISPECIES: Sec-independent protein translocase protein TatB [unclassified Corallococcus]MBN9682997.1 twin-arginine translocase subunit TatB [Corallococcus sp. NCSPR001]WAS85467.1 Sec-independent protein translocase protein TatB [Corallococcus sp. NCRR]
MFNIGAGEMVFILVAALIVLGPQRLPELARAIGKFMREFRRQTDDVRNVVEREFYAMDEDFNRMPPTRPGTRVPSPPPELAPSSIPGAAPANVLAEPAPELAATVDPANVPAPSEAAGAVDAAPAAGPQAVAEAGAAPAQDENGLPQLAPIPGTVARNAPKRS